MQLSILDVGEPRVLCVRKTSAKSILLPLDAKGKTALISLFSTRYTEHERMNETVQKEKDRYSCNLPFMSFCITKAQLS